MLWYTHCDRCRQVLWRKKKAGKGNDETLLFKIGWSEETSLRRSKELKNVTKEAMQMPERRAFQAKRAASAKILWTKYLWMSVSDMLKQCWRWGVGNGLDQRGGEMAWNVVRGSGGPLGVVCTLVWTLGEVGGKALENFEEEWHLTFIKDYTEVSVKIKQKVTEGRNIKFKTKR